MHSPENLNHFESKHYVKIFLRFFYPDFSNFGLTRCPALVGSGIKPALPTFFRRVEVTVKHSQNG